MLVSKNPCGPNAKPDRPNTKPGKPNTSKWNIDCVGSPGVGSSCWACTFHVVCVNFICVGYPTQASFWVEYGLNSISKFDVNMTYILLFILLSQKTGMDLL